MSKITRATQLLFASLAGTNQLSKFGSFAAGTPVRYSGTTVTPANIQALSNFLDGWYAAVEGATSPAIEDMNSLFYLAFYQLAYLMQQGIPEWDSGTTYYIGNRAVNSAGKMYISKTNSNLNNALTDTTNWQQTSPIVTVLSGTGTFTPGALVTWIKVKVQGGGGGGGGSGTGAGTGTSGIVSTFGASLSAFGGSGGHAPPGGQNTTAIPGIATGGDINITGQTGPGMPPGSNSATNSGTGGNSMLGFGGPGSTGSSTDIGPGFPGTGYGSGGGGASNNVNSTGGGGGAGGGYLEKTIRYADLLSSYVFACGAGGAGGVAGTGGSLGGVGANGTIIVEEYFD